MAKKGVKMNLADFNGPQHTELPSAPTGAESSYQRGGFSGGRGGGRGGYSGGGDRDRDGGRDGGDRRDGGGRDGGRSYGDREERAPRRERGEDGEGGEEEEAPSRADEADKWRRRDAPQAERRSEEMPGRSDNEDKWRPRGGAPSSGGGFGDRQERRPFGGDRDGGNDRRSYGGDRDGDRRPYGGDRDGGSRGGFDSERRSGGFDGDRRDDRRGGGFGGDDRDRRGGGGFGEQSGGDSRPAHLKNLMKKGGAVSNDQAASGDAPAATPAPAASSRFAKPPPEENEAGEEERPAREERRPYGGDREQGGGGGERRSYGGGDRDGGERRSYGGSSGGGGRFSDRDGGSSGGGGGRFGDRDGGRDGGSDRRSYGGARDGGYEPRAAATGVSRYGGYGGAARTGGASGAGGAGADMGPLPSGPRQQQQQDNFDDAPRSALRKPVGAAQAAAAAAKKKDDLTAKPQAMEDRNVEVDESLTKKGVVSLAQKVSPLETAVAENLTITADQLTDSMNRLKIDSIKESTVAEFGNVLAKSIIDAKLTLAKVVASLTKSGSASASAASSPKGVAPLLLETLVAFKSKKGDKALLELVSSAADLDIVSLVSGGLKGSDLDSFLDARGLLILKPIPDLTAGVAADLAAGAGPEKVLATISGAVDPKLAPGLGVTNAVAGFVFGLVFATAGKADLSVLPAWSPLIARVAPGFDADAQLRILFEAQAAWFKSGATKALLKETYVALYTAKLIQPLVYDAWRNDMVEKAKNGKSKALLQVHTWITDIQPKLRPSEEEQYGADEDLANEYGDGNDD